MHVRATEVVLDEGRIYAVPGDVGEVLDAGEMKDGGRWIMVSFPGAPGATTCILGEEVQPLLAVVDPASEPLAEPAPEPVAPSTLHRRRPRAAVVLGLVTSAAVAVALLMWRASPTSDAGTVAVQQTPQVPLLADAHGRSAVELFMGERIPPAEAIPSDWSRPPCPKDPRVRTVQGLCFLAYGKPPCGVGYEHEGECLIPIAKGKPLPAAILRE
jgi:hypothetical protein